MGATAEATEVKTAFTTTKVIKSKPTITPGDAFGPAESKRNVWVADIDPKLIVDDILEPGYWAHVAAQMTPMDLIEARWEDGARIVTLRVLYCERTYAKVRLVATEELGGIVAEAPESVKKHYVEWKGTTLKHCVIRKSDGMVVSSGHREKNGAIAWMVEHEKV